ncbi:hypothetical protein HYW17_02965 [Candidatus Uhrbacteria bacterium]|nr:hypothetical protein [Candidatus Uhrbacteria bacterium]
MPYCLIGKLVVWGVLPLAYLFFSIWACSALTQALRKPLLGHYYGPNFWIESAYNAIDYTGPNTFMAGLNTVIVFLLAPFLNTLGFLEFGIRYALKRWRKTATPAALA